MEKAGVIVTPGASFGPTEEATYVSPGTSAGEDPGSSGSDPKKRIKLNN